MNELYIDSMAAAVDRLYDEADVGHRRRRRQREEDLLRRRQPQRDGPGRPRTTRRAVFELAERVKAGLRRLETFPKPVVAAINGAALGGGFEIALACNHRIVVDDR